MALDQQPKKAGASAPAGAGAELQKGSNFLREVQVELKKTTWPTRAEANRLTLVVIGVIVVLGIYMGILDYGLSLLVSKFSLIK
jgi:preprotein translocase subunit SecE